MQVGMVGLGRMGGEHGAALDAATGISCAGGYAVRRAAVAELEREGMTRPAPWPTWSPGSRRRGPSG